VGNLRAALLATLALAVTACSKCSPNERLEGAAPSQDAVDEEFCGPSFFAMNGACAHLPESLASPPTLLYYAHGMFPDGARPARELDIVRAAADIYGFAVLAPRGRKGLCTWSDEVKTSVCWPTKREAVDLVANEILGSWTLAEHALVKSIGMRFSRHYALGFSNGGYFMAYVAPDGLLSLDGAAIVGAGRTDVDDAHLAKTPIPIFLGVGSEEAEFTLHAAARLSSDLSEHGWPVDLSVHEGRGHELGDDDFDLAWVAWGR
jgi:predicted esterase